MSHSSELSRNITIKLGYANAKVRESLLSARITFNVTQVIASCMSCRSTNARSATALVHTGALSRYQTWHFWMNKARRLILVFICMNICRNRSFSSSKEDSPKCDKPGCNAELVLLRYFAIFSLSVNSLVAQSCISFSRHVSFVDCPGHDILMATMLNGAAVMDAALLLIGMLEAIPTFQFMLLSLCLARNRCDSTQYIPDTCL
jgi:hypothetical protein